MQDAYTLALGIREHNSGIAPTWDDRFIKPVKHTWLSRLVEIVYACTIGFWLAVLLKLFTSRKSRTAMQKTAYAYEQRRKSHTAIITVASRIMGYIATLGGPVGYFLKVSLFRLIGLSGMAGNVFCLPMKAVV